MIVINKKKITSLVFSATEIKMVSEYLVKNISHPIFLCGMYIIVIHSSIHTSIFWTHETKLYSNIFICGYGLCSLVSL